jgi:hypothetical protein
VENWGDDVPEGKVTDFHRSVQKKDGEAVLFSWIEWPSKDVRDAAMMALMADARMKTLKMPFDGQRMIFGGLLADRREGIGQGHQQFRRLRCPGSSCQSRRLHQGGFKCGQRVSRNLARCLGARCALTDAAPKARTDQFRVLPQP